MRKIGTFFLGVLGVAMLIAIAIAETREARAKA